MDIFFIIICACVSAALLIFSFSAFTSTLVFSKVRWCRLVIPFNRFKALRSVAPDKWQLEDDYVRYAYDENECDTEQQTCDSTSYIFYVPPVDESVDMYMRNPELYLHKKSSYVSFRFDFIDTFRYRIYRRRLDRDKQKTESNHKLEKCIRYWQEDIEKYKKEKIC